MHSLNRQTYKHYLFYVFFGGVSALLLIYFFSNTLIHFTTSHQFPINSFERFPLSILIFPAELFSLLFALYFVYTLLTGRNYPPTPKQLPNKQKVSIAVLLPMYNEPKEIIQRTIINCLKLTWPGKVHIYVLDDSTTAEYKHEVEAVIKHCGFTLKKKSPLLYESENLSLIRRSNRTGYKAGNINNALKNHVTEPFFVILDVDQAPDPIFLEKTMDYFSDENVGFVQTPQYFTNDGTPLERAAKIGSNIFFQAQTASKARDGAMPFCGTNVVVRRDAFMAVNGFAYYSATEDIDLGIRMNMEGYHGVYLPQILAYGYAPSDAKAYFSQQYRWANGNLAILRERWSQLLFFRGFSLRYQVHMLFTLGWWFIGISSFLFVIVPILSLLTGLGTHHTWLPTELIGLLYVHVGIGIAMIYVALHLRDTRDKIRWSDALLEYSLITNSMFVYMKAAVNALFKRYVSFIRTDKTGVFSGYKHIWPNIFFAFLCFGLSCYALSQGLLSTTLIGQRTFLPVSLLLLFYSLVFASSILFVQPSNVSTAQPTISASSLRSSHPASSSSSSSSSFSSSPSSPTLKSNRLDEVNNRG